MKWKKRRRKTSQVFATEKPSPYVIVSLLATGIALLLYFFWPFGGVTSPPHPQPATALFTNAPTVLPLPPETPGSAEDTTNSLSALPIAPANAASPTADITDTGMPAAAPPTNAPPNVGPAP